VKDRYTFGIEEEYQLVEPGSWSLASRADDVLRTDWADRVEGELQETMLEIGTPVCRDAAEAAARVRELRFHTATAAAAHDLVIVSAGLHPFSRWEDHRTSRGSRSSMLLDVLGQLAREEQFFGLHVHVHVPDDDVRIRTLAVVRRWTPHLLALSCSSPFHEGHDTGYASYRSILNRRIPLTGPPPRLRDMAHYRAYVDTLIDAGAIPDARTLYWSIRPSSRYPTLEFRINDATPHVDDAVAIACLARTLTAAAAEGVLAAPGGDDELALVALRHDEWLAARDGRDAVLVSSSERAPVDLRSDLRALLRRLEPVAQQLGDEAALEHVDGLLDGPTVAERLRSLRRQGRDDRELVEWLYRESELGTGMDRRRSQRPDPSDSLHPQEAP